MKSNIQEIFDYHAACKKEVALNCFYSDLIGIEEEALNKIDAMRPTIDFKLRYSQLKIHHLEGDILAFEWRWQLRNAEKILSLPWFLIPISDPEKGMRL